MIKCKCINKERDKHGNITAYILEDTQGNKTLAYPKILKSAIKEGLLSVDNLKLTKDGRLIDDYSIEQNIDKFIGNYNINGSALDELIKRLKEVAVDSASGFTVTYKCDLIDLMNKAFNVDIRNIHLKYGFIEEEIYTYKNFLFRPDFKFIIKLFNIQNDKLSDYNRYYVHGIKENGVVKSHDIIKENIIKTFDYMDKYDNDIISMYGLITGIVEDLNNEIDTTTIFDSIGKLTVETRANNNKMAILIRYEHTNTGLTFKEDIMAVIVEYDAKHRRYVGHIRTLKNTELDNVPSLGEKKQYNKVKITEYNKHKYSFKTMLELQIFERKLKIAAKQLIIDLSDNLDKLLN